MGENQPDPKWVEWAEAECVRRLTIALAETRARKAQEATEELERSFSAWTSEEPKIEVRVIPSLQTQRVIRVHDGNLQNA